MMAYRDVEKAKARKRFTQKKASGSSTQAVRRWRERNPEKNKQYHRETGKRLYDIWRQFVDSVKSVPCHDCKQRYIPCVMEFDHVREEKLFNISASCGHPKEMVEEEMAKCDVVCANCHRIRTHNRKLARL